MLFYIIKHISLTNNNNNNNKTKKLHFVFLKAQRHRDFF